MGVDNEDWGSGVPVQPVYEEQPCDGLGCIDKFTPTWHTQRRCDKCRKEKRPYKQDHPDHPF